MSNSDRVLTYEELRSYKEYIELEIYRIKNSRLKKLRIEKIKKII